MDERRLLEEQRDKRLEDFMRGVTQQFSDLKGWLSEFQAKTEKSIDSIHGAIQTLPCAQHGSRLTALETAKREGEKQLGVFGRIGAWIVTTIIAAGAFMLGVANYVKGSHG